VLWFVRLTLSRRRRLFQLAIAVRETTGASGFGLNKEAAGVCATAKHSRLRLAVKRFLLNELGKFQNSRVALSN
jgi:hypothetical protein